MKKRDLLNLLSEVDDNTEIIIAPTPDKSGWLYELSERTFKIAAEVDLDILVLSLKEETASSREEILEEIHDQG